MRKYLGVLFVLLVLCVTLLQATAQNTVFHLNDQVVMKSGIRFVWMRSDPNSSAEAVYVINSAKKVLLIKDAEPTFDGVQNWWHVSTMTNPIKDGWVEENSLSLLATPTPVPSATSTLSATQMPLGLTSTSAQIREGIPYVWLRSQPDSTSKTMQTVYFARPTDKSQCLPLMTKGETRTWDGTQWWRLVSGANTTMYGWVEEKSLADCNPDVIEVTPETIADLVSTPIPADIITPLAPVSVSAVYQPFEKGLMIERQDTQAVYVLLNSASYGIFTPDNYANWPVPTQAAPAGLYTPVNAFGKVWGRGVYFDAFIRDALGWAIAPEQSYTTTLSGYEVASAAKPDTHTVIQLPDGRTVDMGTAFITWSFR